MEVPCTSVESFVKTSKIRACVLLLTRLQISDGCYSFLLLDQINNRHGGPRFPPNPAVLHVTQVRLRLNLVRPRPSRVMGCEVLGCRLAPLKVCSLLTGVGLGWGWVGVFWIPAQQAVEGETETVCLPENAVPLVKAP